MRKLLYILPVLLILGFAACENYVDITPTGKKTVDSTETYYELVALPNRSYYPSSFALLSDNVWSKESNIIGKEYLSSDGINMTFNEDADRKELSDNNLYANCYQYILRSNIVISLVDHSTGDKDVKELAKAEAKISDGDSTKDTEAKASTGGTITGGSGTIELTNKLQNPKFVLDIIKKDAEKDENSNEVFLSDVEFKLEKLKAEKTTEGKTQYTVDTGYKFSSNNKNYLTGITGTDGEITKNPFKNLEPGRYRLTETKAHPGYNLLSKSIDIEFTQDGKYKIDDGDLKNATGDAASGYTVTLTVLNRKTPELPHTGADAPSLWLLIGMPLAVAGLLIFTFRYNRKGGRRH